MKLSEMNAEQLMRTLCTLTPLLCCMAEDPRVAAALDAFAEADADNESMLARGAALLGSIVPVLLTDYEDEFFRAAAILTGKSAETLRKQSGLAMFRELKKCWEDDLALFFCCAGNGRPGRS